MMVEFIGVNTQAIGGLSGAEGRVVGGEMSASHHTTPQEVHHTTGSTPHHRKYTIPAGSVCTVFEGCELSLVPMALVALTEYW